MKKIKIILVIITIIFLSGCQNQEKMKKENKGKILTSINAKEFFNLTQDKNNILIDIRTQGEFNQGHIKNAQIIDYYSQNFQNKLQTLDKTKTYLIYCRSGSRSASTLYLMEQLGFENVYNLEYGLIEWVQSNYKLIQ